MPRIKTYHPLLQDGAVNLGPDDEVQFHGGIAEVTEAQYARLIESKTYDDPDNPKPILDEAEAEALSALGAIEAPPGLPYAPAPPQLNASRVAVWCETQPDDVIAVIRDHINGVLEGRAAQKTAAPVPLNPEPPAEPAAEPTYPPAPTENPVTEPTGEHEVPAGAQDSVPEVPKAAKDVIEFIATADPLTLEAIQAAEEAGAKRKTVFDAIAARRAELTA